jgi:hypothetical protein
MQANSITLSVDPANDSNPENQVFARYEERVDRTTYIGSGHTVGTRNQMQFYRTAPKRNGESRGSAKSAIKFTLDVEVSNASGDGNITLPLIGEVSFSVPVGATPAQTMELRQQIISVLDADTVSAALVDILDI